MSESRTTGLMLMGVAIAAFLGTTSEMLPAAVFFPALALFAIGAWKFVRTNSEALAKAEKRVERRLNPTIRENRHAQAQAERDASRQGQALGSLAAEERQAAELAARAASGAMGQSAQRPALEIEEEDSNFVVTTDVSFPVEVQSGDALADQLRKLNELMSQGVLTEEEYAIAKAKLLG